MIIFSLITIYTKIVPIIVKTSKAYKSMPLLVLDVNKNKPSMAENATKSA